MESEIDELGGRGKAEALRGSLRSCTGGKKSFSFKGGLSRRRVRRKGGGNDPYSSSTPCVYWEDFEPSRPVPVHVHLWSPSPSKPHGSACRSRPSLPRAIALLSTVQRRRNRAECDREIAEEGDGERVAVRSDSKARQVGRGDSRGVNEVDAVAEKIGCVYLRTDLDQLTLAVWEEGENARSCSIYQATIYQAMGEEVRGREKGRVVGGGHPATSSVPPDSPQSS